VGRVAAAITCVLCAAPRLAEACPACAASADRGIGQYILIGALLTVPYAVGAIVFTLIRKNLD
jgi:hypothetical protein